MINTMHLEVQQTTCINVIMKFHLKYTNEGQVIIFNNNKLTLKLQERKKEGEEKLHMKNPTLVQN